MSLIGRLHHEYVFQRRVRVLTRELAALLPPNAKVLDVGCGDGLIALRIQELRPDVSLSGIDVLVRPQTHVPVIKFDGTTIPHPDNSFDAVMFVDVLHHTEDPNVLLREARRVARQAVVIKDHHRDGFLAGPTLRFMDWVGNAHHGVVLPYNYWPEARWEESFAKLGLKVVAKQRRLGLYPAPASWFFDRGLHFVARLDVNKT
jgi:ubiquinone/menaquinone biosynthesis C-methylase UbiE